MTEKEIADILSRMYRRCEIARACGISERDRVEGTPVPEGWQLDFYTDYWLPENLTIVLP